MAMLRWFSVRAAIKGTPEAVFRDAVPDLLEELEARPHLRSPRVTWDAESCNVIVEVEDEFEDGTVETARRSLNDDISDAIVAVLTEWDDYAVDYLDVRPHSGVPGS